MLLKAAAFELQLHTDCRRDNLEASQEGREGGRERVRVRDRKIERWKRGDRGGVGRGVEK